MNVENVSYIFFVILYLLLIEINKKAFKNISEKRKLIKD